MAEAYADRYNALGGRLLTGRAATGILMDGGRASGVELADGRRIPAAQVVAAIHPKFVLGLLPREAVPDGLRRRVENFRESPAVFCLHGLVDADALPARPYNIYRIKERGHDGRRDVAFIQVRSSRRPGRNLVTAIHNSAYNDWRPWFDTRTGSRGAEYNRAKRARADLLIQDVRAETGFDGPIDIIDTFSPLSLRDWVGAPEGGCYGVEHTSDQMIGLMRLARKAAPGLHFIGHSIMAPGILGATLGALNGVGRIAGRDRLARAIGV
jgi:all-trans-retinol 13,14-reductase